ncbi:uncharacterized protein LOC129942792 [Eupeodes corollae]|uniref:uncharacterized protein LOC129942792 n=1 Tax=Eupeodes corollae TaxID=290404 RepID=UPI00248FDBF9|nr:uncharacterized protein LOC129942792 [Eupeodes corollae]
MIQTNNNNQAKLFDKKFVALTLRDVRRCEKCKRGYDTKYRVSQDNKPNSSRPVLLNCGHNICENCIYQNRNHLECAVCQVPIEFEHTRWLKKSYDLNFCLLGQLANSISFLGSEPVGGGGAATMTTGMLAAESFIQKCSECEQAPAIGICMNCRADFCKRCFTSVHQNSKVLKKHKLSEFEMQRLQLRLPKEKFCKTHKRMCDKFCVNCQKIYCINCIRLTHNAHHVNALSIENAKNNDKIISFLETMKQTRENIRKAQKDIRICENQLLDYASSITLEINDYFLDLHNFLQIEERRILEEFKVLARPSQNAIHEACAKLSDSQTTLNNMRATLEGFLQKPPNNMHINAILETATTQLEQMPCQIQISQMENNPFVFKRLREVQKEITSSYSVVGNDPKIHIRITPMYGDHEHSFEISSDKILSPDPTESCINFTIETPRRASVSSSSTIAIGKSRRDGRVTHIISPVHFYVQEEEGIKEIRKRLANIDENSFYVDSVQINEMYAVLHVQTKQWHRGVVIEELKKTKNSKDNEQPKYKMFLLDYGIYEDYSKRMLRVISEQTKSISTAAVPCRLVDIGPPGGDWTKEARELMEEIIENKPVQVSIQDTTRTPWSVEVTVTNSGGPISIRDALLYTGIAIDTSVSSSQRNQKFSGSKPTQLSKMKQSLLRPIHHTGEIFRVNVSHIENPHRFFAIKFAHLEELTKLENEMELDYTDPSQRQIIFYAQLHMCCALFFEEKWYRGCVEEINGPNNIRIRLVDDGRTITTNWRELYVLKERFLVHRELSIECSLADIQPLQEKNYEWTDNAIAEFVRMTSNPNIQMTISSSNQFRYQVILNVVKKHLDINVGAMLVKFKQAVSTGDCSVIAENVRTSPIDKLLISDTELKPIPPPAIKTLKRTPIQVIHINNPGDFYIYMVEHIPGILKFQEQLQIAQEERLENETISEDINWKVDDHCLLYASVNEGASDQWFRGIIKNIDENEPEAPYSVFLRDKGVVLRDIQGRQLSPIEDVYKRVSNAAILCHLACVHPTGGMKTWSHSAIDEFRHNISHFESIGGTTQGSAKNFSIPVVLWGMLTETNDALGPCTPKYTNINKMLVSAGLAHLVEKIDITRQMDQFVQDEIQQGQQTLQDWYKNFKKTLDDLPVCSDDFEEPELNKSNISNYEIGDLIENNKVVTEWLPAEPIEKTVFTAYPTYVDYDACVYLHDAEKHHLINGMKKKINEELDLGPGKVTDDKWAPGQPCLARYHLDGCLYRAVIHVALPNKKFEVRFVDYGNVEACELRDLYRMTAFPNIPIQAVRFTIEGIRPRGGQEKFCTTVLDLIHGLIVDKMCGVRVPNGEENKEVKQCRISFNRNDLTTYLIQNEFASGFGNTIKLEKKLKLQPLESPCNPLDESNNSEDELREFMKHQICDPTGEEPNINQHASPANKPTGMFQLDQYKKMYEKMQKDKLYQSIVDDDDSQVMDAPDLENSDDDEVRELEFSFRSNYWHVDDNLEGAPPPAPRSEAGSNFDAFDPCDSSSLLSNFSGIEVFKPPQLPSSVKSFYCEIAYVRSPTVVHIFPHLSELEYRQLELARRIKSLALRTPVFDSFEAKTPCLARYSKDKNWYRAIIRSHNASLRLVKVFYVDFLNSELVHEEHVRRCPNDLLAWPLRTFEMKIYGVIPNPRLREKDVKQAFKKCVTGRKLYAKIVLERGKIPEISLYKSRTEREATVYEDLIIQKYFCKE